MTMATSVDSLLEKLKQEELYLSTKLVLNALQGVESSLISIHKLSYVLCSEPADRTTHQSLSLWHRLSSTDALGQIL
ncbi:hypothetical protein IGI04_015657 [Brassica rapa subsp. trilocularis]|uniref:Rx N-terminal domain-containing protein n=1 Tax=Brassica rapa subsp. trilocularis TaxID=1813537 RepID=A0ABQ7MT76_BRACM|nr:hypothetical protein IGI04_015657 [Brassica rapa subsp. trilocularis]